MSALKRVWNFKNVSPAEAGDFLQITFADKNDNSDRSILLSTQFEFPQDYDLQVEGDEGDEGDEGEWYFARLTVTEATLSRTTLTMHGSAQDEPIEHVINYEADEDEFAELVRVLKIMLPKTVILP